MPDVLLGVEGGEHYGLVVDAGGVLIDGSGGLGAEVAVAGIEVESADVMGAVGAGELHAAFDASDGVEAFHSSSVVFWRRSGRHGGGAAKVIRIVGGWEFPKLGMRLTSAAEAAISVCGFIVALKCCATQKLRCTRWRSSATSAELRSADGRVARLHTSSADASKKQVPPLRRRGRSGSGRNDKV
ncbi:MAG: hypothetical protein WBW98_04095 [Candidatus Sulfotelmatobacter sp.]